MQEMEVDSWAGTVESVTVYSNREVQNLPSITSFEYMAIENEYRQPPVPVSNLQIYSCSAIWSEPVSA